MDPGTKLEIQNLTPYPMVWAHVEPADAPAAEAPGNLLREALAPSRGRVFDIHESGTLRLVCSFHTGGEPDGVHGPTLDLLPGRAVSARVELEADGTYRTEYRDAMVYRGDGGGRAEWTGRYRWEPTYGRSAREDRGHDA